MQILFKRDSNGNVRVWSQEINPEGTGYRTIAGVKDGEMVRSEWTMVTEKNVGRSNQTSLQEQTRLEVAANYTKKLAQGGYHEDEANIDKPKFIKPMLAQTYGKDPKKAITGIAYKTGKVFSQPKYDGMRCVIDASGMWSRYGKPIVSAPHIFSALQPVFVERPELILDGELYADQLAEDFQRIMSLAKKTKNLTPAELAESQMFLQYHIYDVISHEGTFAHRHAAIKELFEYENAFNTPGSFMRMVPTEQVRDETHLDELNESYLELKLEGQMVRLDTVEYEIGKRSWQLQKRKVFVDGEFPIVSITPGVGNRSKVAGTVTFRLPDGSTSSASIKGDFNYARALLEEADEYVDGDATIRYMRLTKDGKPYPAVCVAAFKGKRDM